jgi:phosphoglycerate kinase
MIKTYSYKSIKAGDRVLMRINANVSITRGKVSESSTHRIDILLPEIKRLLRKRVKLVLMTHVGRPIGSDGSLTTKPIAYYLSKKLRQEVLFTPQITGTETASIINSAKNGSIIVLENLRFDIREKKNNAIFAKSLARLGDLYINNAFGVCHRKHASIHAITRYIPSFAGQLLVREVKELSKRLKEPAVLIVGGIKLETKVPVIEHLAPQVNDILTAGGVAVAMVSAERKKRFFAGAQKISEVDQRTAFSILQKYSDKIHLPVDFLIQSKVSKKKKLIQHESMTLKASDKLFDIGPLSVQHYLNVLKGARTVIWNGPMGQVEWKQAQNGTLDLARGIVRMRRARTVVGGGDTVTFLEKEGLTKKFSFVSSGGGAMLEFLAGNALPGLEVLKTL